jgi:hypothetical protein
MAYPQTSLPNTAHTVFYAYTIVGNGIEIGSFEKFGSSFTRSHERIREVLYKRGPQVKEIIWGGTDIQVTLTKVELYREAMFEAFGVNVFTVEDFNQVVDILEVMHIPAIPNSPQQPPDSDSGRRIVVYKDCVPTVISKDVDTTTAKIVENLTLECRTVEGYYE